MPLRQPAGPKAEWPGLEKRQGIAAPKKAEQEKYNRTARIDNPRGGGGGGHISDPEQRLTGPSIGSKPTGGGEREERQVPQYPKDDTSTLMKSVQAAQQRALAATKVDVSQLPPDQADSWKQMLANKEIPVAQLHDTANQLNQQILQGIQAGAQQQEATTARYNQLDKEGALGGAADVKGMQAQVKAGTMEANDPRLAMGQQSAAANSQMQQERTEASKQEGQNEVAGGKQNTLSGQMQRMGGIQGQVPGHEDEEAMGSTVNEGNQLQTAQARSFNRGKAPPAQQQQTLKPLTQDVIDQISKTAKTRGEAEQMAQQQGYDLKSWKPQ